MSAVTIRPAVVLAIAAGVVAGLASDASATLRRDPMTLDRDSYSVLTHGLSPSHIYHVVTTPGEGRDVSAVGPLVHVTALDFGAVAPDDNVLDISNGEAAGDYTAAPYVYFSVSDASQGLEGTVVRQQSVLQQQASDRFVVKASRSPSATVADGGKSSAGATILSLNQTYYNFAPSIAPDQANTLGAQDDADSLEITEFRLSGDSGRTRPVYFTMDAASPTLTSQHHSAATWDTSDVLYTPVGSNTPQLFLDNGDLGLGETDVIDGLAAWDGGVAGAAEVGDAVLISLAPGSPYLVNNGFSPADIFVATPTGDFHRYLSAADLGLLATDNVDAIDVGAELVVVPEPATVGLAAIGVLLGSRRRRG